MAYTPKEAKFLRLMSVTLEFLIAAGFYLRQEKWIATIYACLPWSYLNVWHGEAQLVIHVDILV
jgi:hypothetical protein